MMTPAGRTVHLISKPFRALCFVLAALTVAFAPLAAHGAAAPTTTTLAITSAGVAVTSVASGTVVVLDAVVKPTAVGLVKFCDAAATYCTDEHLLGTAQVTSTGHATYAFSPGAGERRYKAIFVGTKVDASSTSATAALAVIDSRPVSTTITATGAPGNYTLTATVAGRLPVATGSVSFLDTTNSDSSLGTTAFSPSANPSILTFAAPYTPDTAGSVAGAIAVGDFRNNGITDLVVANSTSSNGPGSYIKVLLGNGDGTFKAGVSYVVGDYPYSIAVGDLNGDGILDLATANSGDTTVTVLLGNGDGTFKAAMTYPVGDYPYSVAMGDFNGDGIPDLATANSFGDTATVLLGNGDGTFKAATTHLVGHNPDFIGVGDFNGDGIMDLATANSNGNTVTVLLSNGDGTFKAAMTYPVGKSPRSLAIGDFNGDGITDLATANSGDNTSTVLLGNGDGTFKTSVTYPVGNDPTSVAIGDFNGDGVPDLATTNYNDNTATVLLGNGDGTFKAAISYSVDEFPSSIAVGDLNGDGITDLATANFTGSYVTVLLNQAPTSTTATLTGVVIPGGGTHVIDASYAGDASHSPGLSDNTVALIGTQIPTTLTLSSSLSASAFGQQVVLTAKLSPYNSGNISTNAETVVFQSNGANIGTGSLSSGVAVLNVTALPLGADAITAVYGGDGNFITSVSASTTVTVAQAGQTPTLTFATINNQTTGAPAFTVSATSASPGAVTYAVTSGPATISGATVTVTGVGTVVLTATQSAAGNYAAATATTSFVVTAGTNTDFTLAPNQSGTSQTVNAGAATTYSLHLAPTGGAYPNTVSFTASGLPNGSSFHFSPSLVPANSGPVTVNFTVDTSAAVASNRGLPLGGGVGPVALGLLLLPFAGIRTLRKRGRKAMPAVLALLLSSGAMMTIAMIGCGGSGGETRQAQTSSITISATSGAISHSTIVTLIVQ